MAIPAGNELVVRVRIDGSAAQNDFRGIEKQTKTAFSRALRIEAGVLGFFFGGIARQAASVVGGLGDMVGRATPIGRVASQFYGKLGAAQSATDRTAAAFGMAGASASKDQILGVYRAFKQIEELKAASQENVRNSIGEQRTDDIFLSTVKDLTFAVKNFTEVLKQFGALFKVR
jgi:hypothetical protein